MEEINHIANFETTNHDKDLEQSFQDAHEIKENKCFQCSKVLSSKWTLKEHVVQVHKKEKNYSCDTCGKSFGLKRNLERHKTFVHDKIKKYPCNECRFIGGQNSDLNRHIQKQFMKILNLICVNLVTKGLQ